MKVKTYRAATLREALAKVKRELGPDAFILGQREIRPSNLLGLVQKNRVEVTAAVEPSTAVAPSNRDSGKRQSVDNIKDRIQISQDSPLPTAPYQRHDGPGKRRPICPVAHVYAHVILSGDVQCQG